MKKIMLVTRSAGIGGVEEHVYQLSRYLVSNDYDVSWVVLSDKEASLKYLSAPGVRFIILKDQPGQSLSSFLLLPELFKIVWKLKPQIVHLHGIRPMLLFSLLPFPSGSQRISSIHGSYLLMSLNESGQIIFLKQCLSAIFHLFSCWRSKIVITVSHAISKELHHLAPSFFLKNTLVIHNGVDCAFPAKHIPPPENIIQTFLPQEMQVVFVGRLDPKKGVELIIRAAAEIEASFSIRYHFFGSGYKLSEYQSISEDFGIKHKMHFWGHNEHVRNFLYIFDVLVLPSYSEGMNLVVLEAMASELPVIGTRVGGIPEAVVNEETGYLVCPGDYKAIAKHLRELTLETEKRKQLGTKGRERVTALFRQCDQFSKIIKCYEDSFLSTTTGTGL